MNQDKPALFIWYNPISEEYELGTAGSYRIKKACSSLPKEFNLLYKLNATSARIGQKLISELNKARSTQNEKEKIFRLDLAS